MTLYKFNKLTHAQQLLMLNIHGAKLDYRKEGNFHIALFQMGKFYVEAYYPREKIEVEKLVAFSGTSKLKPYLEKIDIRMLLVQD